MEIADFGCIFDNANIISSSNYPYMLSEEATLSQIFSSLLAPYLESDYVSGTSESQISLYPEYISCTMLMIIKCILIRKIQ